MDVSDFRYLQIIYTILADHEFERISFSNFQFRQLIINGFRNLNISIHIYDESNRLYTIERTILIFFPENNKKDRESTAFLNRSLKHCVLPIHIGYVIPNKTGACVIRIELPDLYTYGRSRLFL